MEQQIPDSAYQVLRASIIKYRGRPVGTRAVSPSAAAPEARNYVDCFVRDFVVSALAFLALGEREIVANFLDIMVRLHQDDQATSPRPTVMPASFTVNSTDPQERLVADYGDRAIGRVSPVDSMYWWTILLTIYVRSTGDRRLALRGEVQDTLKWVLERCLPDGANGFPSASVPDGSMMIDRPLGVSGHPLELQVLQYAALRSAQEVLAPGSPLGLPAARGAEVLRNHLRSHYWLDLVRLQIIYRFPTEEFDHTSNPFNIQPEAMPEWVQEWMPDTGGYFAGNLGPGRLDYRYFALGNLLAVVFDLASPAQASALMALYEARREHLIGHMPAKICYPALSHDDWVSLTGSDPKNRRWSYHNGGNWPVLLWVLVAAALKAQRLDLATHAYEVALKRLSHDDWPEYYDTLGGRFIGLRANRKQVWSAAATVFAGALLETPGLLEMFPSDLSPQVSPPVAA
jgi:hypothetical protein